MAIKVFQDIGRVINMSSEFQMSENCVKISVGDLDSSYVFEFITRHGAVWAKIDKVEHVTGGVLWEELLLRRDQLLWFVIRRTSTQLIEYQDLGHVIRLNDIRNGEHIMDFDRVVFDNLGEFIPFIMYALNSGQSSPDIPPTMLFI